MSEDAGAELRSLYEPEGGVQQIFASKVADYVASRPDYPAALFEELRTACNLQPGSVVADIGAGTGLLTHGLLQHGYQVVAVEPNQAMRQASDYALSKFSGYCSVEGSAESIPLEAGSVDLVTAAQAFHWFEVGSAQAECLRVLRPGAKVALIWNDRDFDDPFQRELSKIFDAYGGAKIAALSAYKEQRDVSQFFGNTVSEKFSCPHEHRLTESGLLSLVFSRSYMPDQETFAGQDATMRIRQVFQQFTSAEKVTVRYNTTAFIGRPE
ncbi:MAG: class I SAM-dependent methyltransferase [Cyanobacteria bacterium J06648_10]